MTERMISPGLQRASDVLLQRARERAEDDAFHIVAVSEFLPPETKRMWSQVSDIWQEQGLGHVISEGDQYGERSLWSFSDKGLAEAARLTQMERQRSWRSWAKRNALAIVGVLAAVVAGIATSISAYIDYLEMG